MSQPKPIYDRNGVRLYHGDSAEVLPALGVKADLIVTSPPFDALRDYGGHAYDFERVAPAIAAALTEGGVMCWHTNDMVVDGGYTNTSLKSAVHFCDELGLRMHDRIILHKQNFVGAMASTRWYQNFDFVWILTKGAIKTFNPIKDIKSKQSTKVQYHGGARDGKNSLNKTIKGKRIKAAEWLKRDAVWSVMKGLHLPGAFVSVDYHPAPMPMHWTTDFIKAYSNPGDLVLDPFSGSGTTAYAAQLLGRRAIGVEIHRPYIEAAIAKRFVNQPMPLDGAPL